MKEKIKKQIEQFREFVISGRLRESLHLQLELRPYLEDVPYWTAAALMGLVAVVYSSAFTGSIQFALWVRQEHPYFLFILTPACLAFSAWLVETYAKEAAGTGIPQVHRALGLDEKKDADQIESLVGIRVGIVVAVSSLLCVFGGGSLGREGPAVHMAACLFYYVGHQFKKLKPYQEHRSWLIAGGAAGVAAAFNAPLAGVVFVLEELSQQHFHQFKTVVITAAIIGGAVAQWISGRYLYFAGTEMGDVPLSSLPWAVALGIFCGLIAFPFHRLLKPDFERLFQKYFGKGIWFAIFAGLLIAAFSIWVSPYTIGGGTRLLEDLLYQKNFYADWKVVLSRFIGPIFSHLSGCAGGFLGPALALGGALGSQFAHLTGYSNSHLLVMVGMAAFLSAIIRAPFTAWVIVMEMTSSHAAIFPLMLSSLVAFGSLKFFEGEHRKRGKILP